MNSKPFAGFSSKSEVTPIPNLFFTVAMNQIENITELKTVLYIFWLLSRRRGYPRFVTYNELLSDPILTRNIKEKTQSTNEILHHALQLAVQHGIILHLRFRNDEEFEDAYFINTENEQELLDEIQQGKITLPGLTPQKHEGAKTTLTSDIYSLYEQNIGMITPIIAEELQDAEKVYPADWIESAFKEAVTLNKRSWKYIARILERWAIEGKDDGKSRRDSKKDNDPDKYIKGKYGHMVKR